MSDPCILVVNPGSTATRLAIFRGPVCEIETCAPSSDVPAASADAALPARLADVHAFLRQHGAPRLDAVVGRGGLLASVPSGTVRVDDEMLADARAARRGWHPSNLGCLIADVIAREHDVPAFIVDPVSVDEMAPEARLCGLPDMVRQSLAHVLNLHAAAREASGHLSLALGDSRFVAAHLGGGFSIVAMDGGRIIDANNANAGGPFSPTRSGTLPVDALVRLCFSGRHTEASLLRLVTREGGLRAHLHTDDAREVERRIDAGDATARLVYDAMAWHTAKEIGAMATVLCGRVDAVILTGGLARSDRFCDALTRRVAFLGPVLRYGGEFEMRALAAGALRVLRGEEAALCYPRGVLV